MKPLKVAAVGADTRSMTNYLPQMEMTDTDVNAELEGKITLLEAEGDRWERLGFETEAYGCRFTARQLRKNLR